MWADNPSCAIYFLPNNNHTFHRKFFQLFPELITYPHLRSLRRFLLATTKTAALPGRRRLYCHSESALSFQALLSFWAERRIYSAPSAVEISVALLHMEGPGINDGTRPQHIVPVLVDVLGVHPPAAIPFRGQVQKGSFLPADESQRGIYPQFIRHDARVNGKIVIVIVRHNGRQAIPLNYTNSLRVQDIC